MELTTQTLYICEGIRWGKLSFKEYEVTCGETDCFISPEYNWEKTVKKYVVDKKFAPTKKEALERFFEGREDSLVYLRKRVKEEEDMMELVRLKVKELEEE